MSDQQAHRKESMLAQGPRDISPGTKTITTAFADWISAAFSASMYRSVGIELDITPADATTIEALLEVSRDGTLWTPAFYQAAITSSLKTLKPDISQITIADLNPAGGTDNRVKLPPIDCRDLHWVRLKLKKTGGSSTVTASAFATGGQGA